MLAFKTNQEAVAKESLQKAVLASNDPLFKLPAIRSVQHTCYQVNIPRIARTFETL